MRTGTATVTGMTPEMNTALREAFTPTRPKQRVNSLFVGRLSTLKRIIQAVEEERAHVVLFGDRGRGKTSLSNAVQQIASQAGYLTIKLTLSGEMRFEELFRNVLKRIPSTYYRGPQDNPFAGRRGFTTFDELLPQGAFGVTELQEVLGNIQGTHVLVILDEYDRVTDVDLRGKLAELIKNLTDAALPVTLLVVGVAEDLDQLLGRHPSIQRSLVAVHLPLMTDREVERIVLAGAESCGISFGPGVRESIAGFAKGLPYYAQLISLHAARSAVGRGSTQVSAGDLAVALRRCVQEAERGVVDAYNQALADDSEGLVSDVVFAAAAAQCDEFGMFDARALTEVPLGMNEEGRERGSLSASAVEKGLMVLLDTGRGGLLQKVAEPGGYRYRFRHPMVRHYVLMRQAEARGLV